VSRPAIAILAVLARSSEMRVTELAKQTGLETTLISRELKQLENDGLAERRADELDGRAALISLSDSGRQAFTSYREVTDEIIAETFADWTAVELEQLAAMLERVLRDFVRTPRVAESTGTP
jgi:DNA-binding MarR family transcriptional regulator